MAIKDQGEQKVFLNLRDVKRHAILRDYIFFSNSQPQVLNTKFSNADLNPY